MCCEFVEYGVQLQLSSLSKEGGSVGTRRVALLRNNGSWLRTLYDHFICFFEDKTTRKYKCNLGTIIAHTAFCRMTAEFRGRVEPSRGRAGFLPGA